MVAPLLEAVNRSPTPVLSTRSPAKEVAPETEAIERVPPFVRFGLTSRVERRVELLAPVFIPSLPLLVSTNLVVPEEEAVKRSDVVAPVLLTIKAALLPASPETLRSPIGFVTVPMPILPILLKNAVWILPGVKLIPPVVEPPKVRLAFNKLCIVPSPPRVIPVPVPPDAVVAETEA